MVVNGVLPIDQLRDYKPSIEVIINRIPREAIMETYKIKLPEMYSSSQFLQVYAGLKGYVTGRSLPDESRAARIVLKDFVNGKLLFNAIRPDYDAEKHGQID